MSLLLFVLACICPVGSLVFAQEVVDVASGPRDVLYSQSRLLQSIDQRWFVPLSPAFSVDPTLNAPLPSPFATDKQPKDSNTSDLHLNPQDQKAHKNETHFRWAPAFGESLLFTGIQHTFNITTEAGTRDALNGKWFTDYIRSVSELRGWSDSDTFMAPYVGHPIEGSVFGFIERQNDPKYRLIQWGDGREYWVSMLRSMAYSAVWHTQWKIGPASEASIGNVMLHASPGFITLVDTPTLGFCTMLAEDAADRYLIIGLENRTNNRAIIILARSFLNPGRTFANMMAFRPPWVRETRLNLFGNNYQIRKTLLEDYRNGEGDKPFIYVKDAWKPEGVDFVHPHPKEADIELTAFPYYETFLGGGSCIGGGGTGAARVNPKFQVLTEVSGCLIMHQPFYNYSADSLFYGGGFRWTPLSTHRFSPFGQFMIGGRKVTYEIDNLALKKQLLDEWNNGNGTLAHYPMRSAYEFETAQNGPSIAVGGGFDWVVTRPFAWRILNVEYTRSWMNDVMQIHPQEGLKISTQAVVRIGTW
ncbi:MAG: hypothetical protein WAK48_28200 [Candidatus Acidiferrum sp.]|jgi:hypothetical protein